MKHSLVRSVLGGISAVALSAVSQAQIKLNEIYASHSGTDLQEFIELKGPAGASLDNYVVCIVEGEGQLGNQGQLDRAWDLTGFSIPTDGYFVLGVSGVAARDFTIVGSGSSGAADAIENGTETFYLIDAGSNANVLAIQALIGTDVDSDNDGITTLPTLGTIVDIVGLADGGITSATPPETIFDGATVTGPDSSFLPAGIYRGLDAPNPWCPQFLDFNEAVNTTQPRTPGAVNSVCPSAATIINYCTAGTTTNNCNATMSSTGTPSVAAPSGFSVGATSVEGQKQGLIFYSVTGQNSLAWGTGSSFLCIKSPTQRTPALNSGGTTNLCDGAISVDFLAFLAANPTAIGGAANGPLSAGNQVQFQCWFRDPPASKSTSLSDGLEVTMVP
ncbi:MAG: hypothetical protein JNN27_11470 [Planctomycetes bacterium]|nr:hypothetical protein [Planctomycetota bacterium]